MTDHVSRAEPLYFGSEKRPLFGWLHRAAAPAKNLGVVFCNPFGHEVQSCHRSLRHWAQSAAGSGISALRFDYDGTGDSAGSDENADRVASWIASIHSAISTLKAETGVQNVALFGVRLGALLATMAAFENPDICALALIAPVVSGKAWLREMRALHGALALGETPDDAVALPENAREALGFLLTEQTQQSLSEIDLTKLAKSPTARILLLDRDDLPSGEKLLKHWTNLGAEVEHQILPGYADMMRDPHESQVPATLIATTTKWLCGLVHDKSVADFAISKTLKISATIQESVQERAVFLDEKRQLFGILSVPREQTNKAVLLLNSGANHRAGPNRIYVSLARHLAKRGILVLRVDIRGVGDSVPHENQHENVVYAARATDDVKTALHYLKTQWDINSCHATGICSGGYHAYKAALADATLSSVILINPLTFNFKPGDSLETPNSQVIAEAERYKKSALQVDKWKNLITGKTDPRVVAQFVGRRAADVAGRRALNVAQKFGYRRRDDLGAALENLARRDVKLHFIFAEGDPGLALLQEQGGTAVLRLEKAGQLTIQCLAGPDHTFTPLWSHTYLFESFCKAVQTD